MKVTYHVEGNSAQDLAKGLRAHLAILEGSGAQPGKRGRRSKAEIEAAKAASEDETDEEELEASDAETDSDDEEELEASDDEDTEEETDAEEESDDEEDTGPTVDMVLQAFQKYAKKNGREAAMKILKKFKVTSVRGLTDKQYPQALKALGSK